MSSSESRPQDLTQDQGTTTPGGEAAGGSRRDFLKVAGTTAAGVLVGGLAAGARPARAADKLASGIPVPKAEADKFVGGKFPKAPVAASSRAIGANDRINIAVVGVGCMGVGHLSHFVRDGKQRNTMVVGISDVYKPRMERSAAYAKKDGGAPTVQADKDYRRLLENKDIDAIVIATPEHWHAQIACHAMEAGKHVYIQKPMSRYLDEAFQVHDTALRTKRVVQVGSQGCSNMIYHTSGKAIRDGRIGPIIMGQGSYCRNNPKGEWNYGIPGDITPETLDWKMWLGSAPERAFSFKGAAGDGEQPERDDSGARFSRYRKYDDYSAGILGDLMPHKLHPFLIASGNPEYPTRVMCIGTQLDKNREVDDLVQVVAEFPSGWSMLFVGSTVNEQGMQDMVRGHKATIYFGNGVEVRPERPYAEEVEGGTIAVEGPTFENHENHENDWLLSIRTGKVPNCNIDLATKVQTIISLAEMSARTGKAMNFDAKTRKVTAG